VLKQPTLRALFKKRVILRFPYGTACADLSVPLAVEQARLADEGSTSGNAASADVAEPAHRPGRHRLPRPDQRPT
jgi:hypothetical protein